MNTRESRFHHSTTMAGLALGLSSALGLSLLAGGCGPVEIDAPIYADVNVDHQKKLADLEQEEETDICEEIETTSVSCGEGANQVTYQYSSQSCHDDLAAVPEGCDAQVEDYLACVALDACHRTEADCEALASCAPELEIFVEVDVDVTVTIDEQEPIVELDEEEVTEVCSDVQTSSVTCGEGNNAVEFSYTSSTCGEDLDAVGEGCGANVGDYLTCLALDACDRKSAPECSALLECNPDLQIFVDVDVEVTVTEESELSTLDEEQLGEVCAAADQTEVTCEVGGAEVSFSYSAEACISDCSALSDECGATVADLQACLAVDACDRANAEECLDLLECDGSLSIFGNFSVDM